MNLCKTIVGESMTIVERKYD